MGRFQRRQDALQPAQQLEGLQRLLIGGRGIARPPQSPQVGVLWTHRGIVQPGRDRVRGRDLAVGILQHIAAHAVEHAQPPPLGIAKASGVPARLQPLAGGLHAQHGHVIVQKGVEQADGVGAPAHAGHQQVGQAADLGQHLSAGLSPDDGLQIAHDHGIGMRPQRRAQQIVAVAQGSGPIAQGGVDSVLQGAAAVVDRPHLGAQKAHAQYVGLLPAHILGAHVDDAGHPQQGRGGGRGHAMLARARLGDQSRLAHALGQQGLP